MPNSAVLMWGIITPACPFLHWNLTVNLERWIRPLLTSQDYKKLLLSGYSHSVTQCFPCCVSLPCVRLRLSMRSHCVTQCFPCCVSLPCPASACVSMCARPNCCTVKAHRASSTGASHIFGSCVYFTIVVGWTLMHLSMSYMGLGHTGNVLAENSYIPEDPKLKYLYETKPACIGKIGPLLFRYRQVSLYCINRHLPLSCRWELSWREFREYRVCLSLEKAAYGLRIGKII